MNGFLVVICGPSGVGKGTVVKDLLKKISNMELSVSSTTRSPRDGEEHGKDYFFLSDEEFTSKVEKGEFLEWANVHTKKYGTEVGYVSRRIKRGRVVLLEIDVQGAAQIKDKNVDAVSIFIVPPSMEELEKRLRGRQTETEEQILGRLEVAKEEIKEKDKFDFIVENDSVENAVDRIANIIKQKREESAS